jgi:hypothetical protein
MIAGIMDVAHAIPIVPDLNQVYLLSIKGGDDGQTNQYQMKYNITGDGTIANMNIDSSRKALVLTINSPSDGGRLAIGLPRDVIDARLSGHDYWDRSAGCRNVTSTLTECDFGVYDDDFVVTIARSGEPQEEVITIQSDLTIISELDTRTLVFNYPKGDSIVVTIKGTSVVPEFSSSSAIIIVTISVMITVIVVSKYSLSQSAK